MNVISLQQSRAKKQTNASWSDDPFNLKGAFKGVNNVNHKRNLESYAQELVANYGKFIDNDYVLSLNELPEDEQNELARLFIESTDREVNECVYGDDFTINSDFTCALLALLKDDCKKTRDNFAATTLKNIIVYYKDSLEDTLIEACHDLHCNEMNEAGYHQHQDLEHGDYYWSKY